MRVCSEHLVHLDWWYWPLTLCHRLVFEIHFPVNGCLVISLCSSILNLRPTPDPPVSVSTNGVLQELLCQYYPSFNMGGGIVTVLKLFLIVVRIHIWDGKVPSKAMISSIFDSPSSLNGDGCMPTVVVVVNLMSIQKMIFNHLCVHELLCFHNSTALEFPLCLLIRCL